MRTIYQKILRRARENSPGHLQQFELVNDDELGRTYRATATRGNGYAIVEIGYSRDELTQAGIRNYETLEVSDTHRVYYTVRYVNFK